MKNQNPYIGQNNNQMGMGQQNPYFNNQNNNNSSFLGSSFNTGDFVKGALIGAVGAYLLTNENAQKAIFKTLAGGASMFQAGIEEMKERMEDAKAELEAERNS
ncbi:MAG: YtxH domain-containing protein [Campylobacterales bacterium]|nr:YtxH domain-containing protein [Campylobacterales bacterium]